MVSHGVRRWVPISGGVFTPGRWLYRVRPVVTVGNWGLVLMRRTLHDGTNPLERKAGQ